MPYQTLKMSRTSLREFKKSEDGAMMALGLYLFIAMAMIGGIAIDVSNLIAARSQLQVAADAAGHAALYYRDTNDANAAKLKAIEVATFGMPDANYGEILELTDIKFGSWDYDTQVFQIDETSRESVMVSTSRISDKSNSIGSYLFQFVGKDDWDVITPSVFTTFRPTCFTEGFVADGIVDIQSNNGFTNGFCIHSNTHVSVNNNNTFEPGTVVSMPDIGDIDMPRSGYEKNDGLQSALRSGVYRLRIITRIDSIFTGLLTSDSDYIPDYITSPIVIDLPSNSKTLEASDFTTGRIHTLYCSGSGKVTLKGLLSEFVLVSDCEIKFSNGTILEDLVIATTDGGAKSFNVSSGLQIGKDDDCAEGGGVQLVTKGSMFFAAGLDIYGSQLIALHDITFAANASGVQGASLVAGGEIDGTSNALMGYCGTGMENNFEANYFRLAK